jgi:hypothetical protein
MIMVMAGNMFIQTAKITTQSTQTNKSNNVAADIANEVSSVIRVATNLAVSGQPTPTAAIVPGSNGETLTIYSLSNATDPANPAAVRVKFSISTATPPAGVEPRQVMEERCTASSVNGFWVFGSCATTTRSLGGIVQAWDNVPAHRFFVYYTAGNQEVVPGATGLTAAQALTVASIKIYVSVKAGGSDTNPAVIENKVFMGNLGLDQSEE